LTSINKEHVKKVKDLILNNQLIVQEIVNDVGISYLAKAF